MNAKDFKKIIFDKLKGLLKSKHFKKTGNSFQYSNGELSYYINLQSSQTSTIDVLKVTVNIGICSLLLHRLEDTSIPENDQRHFEKRIGSYFDERQDKWWTVTDSNEAETSAIEIIKIIETKVLPEFSTIQTTNDLINLWKQNESPGLTEKQRKEYLSILERHSLR